MSKILEQVLVSSKIKENINVEKCQSVDKKILTKEFRFFFTHHINNLLCNVLPN